MSETPKDANDLLKSGGAAALRDSIDKASPLGFAGAKAKSELPMPVCGSELCTLFPDPPEDVVEGLIGVGEKMMMAGGSKSSKTWGLLGLVAAVEVGGKWLGFQCVKGQALFLNFEISDKRMGQRLRMLRKGGLEADRADFLNLRGVGAEWAAIIDHVEKLVKTTPYKLIVIDPVYKLLAGANENNNTEVAAMLGKVEQIAVKSGAAVVFAHHFSKGNKSDTDNLDRASGAGAFARDPDAIVTLVGHEVEGCYTVEADVRNYRRPEPRVVEMEFPKFVVRKNLNPTATKKPGRKKKGDASSVVDAIANADGPMTSSELEKVVKATCGSSERSVRAWRKGAEDSGLIECNGGLWQLLEDKKAI